MKQQGISIIIPNYNNEKYLERCLDSIQAQTFSKWEVIVVDDASTDQSVKVLQNYQKAHPKFPMKILTNSTNHGAGYNRNVGLKEAKYHLISFIDGDDYVESNFLEALYQSMQENDSDLALCDLFVRYPKNAKESDIRSVACDGGVSKENVINNGHAASPCNKLFKKEMLEQFPFPEGVMNEDVPTVLAILLVTKKISYTRDTYYNYVQHENSQQNSHLSAKRFDIFKALDELKKRINFEEFHQDYWDMIVYQQLIMFLIYVPPKEENFMVRYRFLKEFYRFSKSYQLRRNHYLWNFLERQGVYHKLYYKVFLKLHCTGFQFLANCMISFYHFYRSHVTHLVIKQNITLDDLIREAKKQQRRRKPTHSISVVIPNYNYARFLYERIYSILIQKVQIEELLILDDCSTDQSREMIDELCEALHPYMNIRKLYNKKNSGTPFKQWQKGFLNTKGDYVWIAEADDYCDSHFLKELLKVFEKEEDVSLAYTDTAFIDADGHIIMRSIIPEIDIEKTGHWDSDFVVSGLDEIKEHAYLNCTIANVSSVLFRRKDYSKILMEATTYRQAGDWLVYLKVFQEGKVAFCHKALNYYRNHGTNVTSLTKKQAHFAEIQRIHDFVLQEFGLSEKQKQAIQERYEFLTRVWNLDDSTMIQDEE